MTFPKENKITKGQWFCKEGENQDVILSTRARIVRNLADFSFPNFLTKSETERVEIIILDALKDDSVCEYYAVKKEEMSEKIKFEEGHRHQKSPSERMGFFVS